MKWQRFVSPIFTIGVLSGVVFAAFKTQDKWMPHVFPNKSAAKPTENAVDEYASHDHGARDDRVKLSPQAQQNLGLDVDTPTPQEYWRTILIPGTVVDRPGVSDRGVTSKVGGIITEIHAKPGDTVKAGDSLFTLQLASEFLQGAQADLLKAAKELQFAKDRRDRIAELVNKGTQSGTTLIEEDNQIKRITTQVQTLRRQLQLFGLTSTQVDSAENGDPITELRVMAPTKTTSSTPDLFEVQELKITLGEQVQAGQTLCLLANHQKLFVEGRAFKSEADALAQLAEQQTPIKAEFADETPGTWPTQEPLRIHHLSNMVDPTSRTFAFFLPLDNQPRTFTQNGKTQFVWRYRPGQRVRLRMPVEKLVTFSKDSKREVLPFVFPTGAVVREGPEAFVFIQSGDLFIRKPVRVLYEDRTDVVVANDGSVSEAEFVVRNQAAAIHRALKAATAAGEGGHGHGHSHDH